MGKNKTSHTSFWSLKAMESILVLLALVFFTACGDDSGSNSNPTSENAMESCTVSKNADSTSYTLKCPDGTQVEIQDGKNGENGAAGKNGNDGKNGQNGQNGSEGTTTPGAGCTLKELGGGSVSLECPDGTKLVFGEDGKVVGKDGSSSSVASAGSSSSVVSVGSSGTSQSAGSQSGVSSSSSSATPTGKTQGYVQFNRDSYTTMTDVAQAGIYLYDADNTAKTATVTVFADSPDTLSITLDRYDRYFYGKLPLAVYGDDFDKGIFAGDKGNLLVEYVDLSTGVTKYDSASVNMSKDTLFTKPRTSIHWGKTYTDGLGSYRSGKYFDLNDKAVIILRDRRLTEGASVKVLVRSTVDEGRYIPLYPVEGGDGTEHIGFVGFTLDEPYDGVVKVEDGTELTVSYNGNSDNATWEMTEFCGLTCSNDGKLMSGIMYPDIQYVCDGGVASFRRANEREISIGKGCTVNNLNEEYGGYTCMSAGAWGLGVDSFTDPRDNQTYKTVKIGAQIWMVKNLNYETKNGYCYENNANNCAKYGRLYTWAEAKTACPSGYHLPDTTEWNALFDAIGGVGVAGKMLKASSGWYNNGNGEDIYSFTAVPAGYRYSNGGYTQGGEDAYFWSSIEKASGSLVAYCRHLNYSSAGTVRHDCAKEAGYSVRCLKD
jgi:uncharacterized protein (TIGR02145 family)